MNTTNDRTDTNGTAAIAENADPSRTREAIRRVVELSGGMDWLQPGQTVVIKPALNSAVPLPVYRKPGILCRTGPDVPRRRRRQGVRGR